MFEDLPFMKMGQLGGDNLSWFSAFFRALNIVNVLKGPYILGYFLKSQDISQFICDV